MSQINIDVISGDEITVKIENNLGGQQAIQFQDEGTNLGTSGDIQTIDFTGSGVTASRSGNKITVNVTGGGGGGGGDVVGPISAVDSRIAAFDGTTGKLLKDGGTTVAALIAADAAVQSFAIQRANHTGTQSVSTVTGLSAVATSGNHTDLSNIGTNTHAQIDSHLASTANPHATTKAQVGLGSVDNTADSAKPVSVAQAAADSAVQAFSIQRANHTGTQSVSTITGLSTVATTGNHTNLSNIGTNTHSQIDSHIASTGNPHLVTKAQVGLSNADNTSDLSKPISTATQTALDLKHPNIQFQDESTNLGTTGTVDTVDFTGAGVTASRTGNKVTVAISSGGGGGSPGGSNTEIQFNNAGSFAGANLIYDNANARLGVAQASPTARLDVAASDTGAASLRVRNGVAPTTPNEGDFWHDGIHFSARINSETTILDGSSMFGYQAGNWVAPYFAAWIQIGASTAQNSIRLIPFFVQRDCTVTDLGAKVTTATSGNCQLAVYNTNSNGEIVGIPLGSTANISTVATGNISGTVTTFNLRSGRVYYAAVNKDNATPTFGAARPESFTKGALTGATSLNNLTAAANAAQGCFTFAQTFGTWPDLTGQPLVEVVTASYALVFFKIGSLL